MESAFCFPAHRPHVRKLFGYLVCQLAAMHWSLIFERVINTACVYVHLGCDIWNNTCIFVAVSGKKEKVGQALVFGIFPCIAHNTHERLA